jgi:hypothetical protein
MHSEAPSPGHTENGSSPEVVQLNQEVVQGGEMTGAKRGNSVRATPSLHPHAQENRRGKRGSPSLKRRKKKDSGNNPLQRAIIVVAAVKNNCR